MEQRRTWAKSRAKELRTFHEKYASRVPDGARGESRRSACVVAHPCGALERDWLMRSRDIHQRVEVMLHREVAALDPRLELLAKAGKSGRMTRKRSAKWYTFRR